MIFRGLAKARVGLTYCELGSGLGLSLNLLAAANPQITFYGNDFNPSHILESRALASKAGSGNAHFFEQSFEEFIDEPSLPPTFNFIALHGIYSWISPENRAHIVEFIKRKLAPGGLLYISYNALPGWLSQMPLRRLLIDHAATQSGPMVGRVQSAVEFAEKLKKANAAYFHHTPHAAQRLTAMHQKPRTYLAHEYSNQDWTPFYHADVVKELADAKVSYLGSAALLENNDGMYLPPEAIEVLKEIKDPTLRETIRDYSAYPLFRRDVFVRGPPLSQGPRWSLIGWIDHSQWSHRGTMFRCRSTAFRERFTFARRFTTPFWTSSHARLRPSASCLHTRRSGRSQVSKFVHDAMQAQGLRLQKEGKTLETEEESLTVIQGRADELESKFIPLWRQLKII